GRLRIVVPQKSKRLIGENDPESKRNTGWILLNDTYVQIRPALFEQYRSVEPGRARSNDDHTHSTFPLPVDLGDPKTRPTLAQPDIDRMKGRVIDIPHARCWIRQDSVINRLPKFQFQRNINTIDGTDGRLG
ncbi:uncharacterized protein METZ01_LOCUS103460, partial [marine metagenome]